MPPGTRYPRVPLSLLAPVVVLCQQLLCPASEHSTFLGLFFYSPATISFKQNNPPQVAFIIIYTLVQVTNSTSPKQSSPYPPVLLLQRPASSSTIHLVHLLNNFRPPQHQCPCPVDSTLEYLRTIYYFSHPHYYHLSPYILQPPPLL